MTLPASELKALVADLRNNRVMAEAASALEAMGAELAEVKADNQTLRDLLAIAEERHEH